MGWERFFLGFGQFGRARCLRLGTAAESGVTPGGRVLLCLPGSAEGLRWPLLSGIGKPGSGCMADFTSDGQEPIHQELSH